jgi:hypothetical protein
LKHWYGDEVALGFWPEKYALAGEVTVHGKGLLLIEQRLAEEKVTVYLREEACRKVHQFLQSAYEHPPDYDLPLFNCVDFVKAVAECAGVSEISNIGSPGWADYAAMGGPVGPLVLTEKKTVTPGELCDAIREWKGKGVPAAPYPRK